MSMTSDEMDLTFVRCPSCRSLQRSTATRCRYCGYLLNDVADNSSVVEDESVGNQKSRVRQRTTSLSEDEVEDYKTTHGGNVIHENVNDSASGQGDQVFVDYQSKGSASQQVEYQQPGHQQNERLVKTVDDPKVSYQFDSNEVTQPPAPAERGSKSSDRGVFRLSGGRNDLISRVQNLSKERPNYVLDDSSSKGANAYSNIENNNRPVVSKQIEIEEVDDEVEEVSFVEDNSLDLNTAYVDNLSESEEKKKRKRKKRRKKKLPLEDSLAINSAKEVGGSHDDLGYGNLEVVDNSVDDVAGDLAVGIGGDVVGSSKVSVAENAGSGPFALKNVMFDECVGDSVNDRIGDRVDVTDGINLNSVDSDHVKVYAKVETHNPNTCNAMTSGAVLNMENKVSSSFSDGALIAWFVYYGDNQKGNAIEIREGRFFISGTKLRESDLVIPHESISTPHCLIKADVSNGLFVQDLMSVNGTFVKHAGNSEYEPVTIPIEIKHGDWFKCGGYEVLVCVVPRK